MEEADSVSINITREALFTPAIEEALVRQRALERLAQVPVETAEVSLFRRILFSNFFYIPLFSILGAFIGWLILEPVFVDEYVPNQVDVVQLVFFPLVCACIVLLILVGEGLIRGTLLSALRSGVLRGVLTFALAFIPLIVSGLIITYIIFPLIFGGTPEAIAAGKVYVSPQMANPQFWSAGQFLTWTVGRSVCWVLLGCFIGVGMYLGRGTSIQLQGAILGGAVGGEIGGVLFDSIDRFLLGWTADAAVLRLIGVCMIGLCVGIFVALSEQLSREGWFRVRTGPLAGKAFVIHHEITSVGSTPNADIYLFKDAEIDPKHGLVHRIGSTFMIEDIGSRYGTRVNGALVHQRRLQSGDQIMLGATILEFEERAKRSKPNLKDKE